MGHFPQEESDKQQLLTKAATLFYKDTGLIPVIGAELEFFLTPDDVPLPFETLLHSLQQRCREESLPNISLEKERGAGQYEIQIDHSTNLLAIAYTIQRLRSLITEETAPLGFSALFDAKPYADQPGSSLHIHIGLFTQQGENTLMRVGEEPYREESDTMRYAIGGLLASMQEALYIFSPNTHDYARFEPKYDAPTTISWGGNNRTVALRIPASSWVLEPTRHIEHRVPAANADPYLTIIAILAGIHHGITQKTAPTSDKIYGDASLPIYGLERLAIDLETAQQYYEQGRIIPSFFSRCHE